MKLLDVPGSVGGECLFGFEDDEEEETDFVTATGFGGTRAFFAVDFTSDDSAGAVFRACLDEERSFLPLFPLPLEAESLRRLALLDERDFFRAEIGLSSSLSLLGSLSSGSVVLVSFLCLRLILAATGGEGRVSARAWILFLRLSIT